MAGVGIGPFKNIVSVGWGGPFLIISGTLNAPEEIGSPFNLGGATGGPGVVPMVTEVPDFDITAFGSDLMGYIIYQGVDALSATPRQFGYVVIFYDLAEIFAKLRLAGIQHGAFVLHTNVNVTEPATPVRGDFRATVYAPSSRPKLEAFKQKFQDSSFDDVADPEEMQDIMMVDGGNVALQPHSHPGVPLINEASVFRQDYPTDGPFAGDLGGPYIRARWRWDFENRNLPPFSPPDFGGI